MDDLTQDRAKRRKITAVEIRTAVWRGIRWRCPCCGKEMIYRSYLKPKEQCGVCHLDLKLFRADDGPAWLTILLVGHLMVPVAIALSMQQTLPQPVALATALILTVLATLLILPCAKGFFINMLWLLASKKVAPNG